MRISAQARIFLAGVVVALVIAGAGKLLTLETRPTASALDSDPRLRALATECKNSGNVFDAIALHYGGVNEDGTSPQVSGPCRNLVNLWDQIEPYRSEPTAVDRVADWTIPIAALVLLFSALPWFWYFILRRIRELRDTIVGK